MITIKNPMVVDLNRFNKMRKRFTKHYFLENCDPNFGGQEIQVPWNSFSLAVVSFISTYEVDPDSVAIRFVHCYDKDHKVLYERMQILTLSPIANEPRQFAINDTPCTWYELANSTINTTTDTDLFNTTYLESFYYCSAKVCTIKTAECLADDTQAVKYARTATVPWLELSALYTDNSSPSNATLCLDAGCRCTKNVPSVKYQHTILFYLRDEYGVPLLNNEKGAYPFTNKAADMSTLCPVKCGVYILPKGRTSDGDYDEENDENDEYDNENENDDNDRQ